MIHSLVNVIRKRPSVKKLCSRIESKRNSKDPVWILSVYAKDTVWRFTVVAEYFSNCLEVIPRKLPSRLRKIFDYTEIVIEQIPTLLTDDEAYFLFSFPPFIPSGGVIVEIGSYLGGSTIIMARGSMKARKGKVYAIDPHDYPNKRVKGGSVEDTSRIIYDRFTKNIIWAGVGRHVIHMHMTSKEAERKWKMPVSLLWIDGNHRYEYVKEDFLLWKKHLKVGGIIAFHDSFPSKKIIRATGKPPLPTSDLRFSAGPRKVIREFIMHSKEFKIIKIVDSITCIRKLKQEEIGTLE